MRLRRFDRALLVRKLGRALLLLQAECGNTSLQRGVGLLRAERLDRLFQRFRFRLQRPLDLLGARAALLNLGLQLRGGGPASGAFVEDAIGVDDQDGATLLGFGGS